jgi:hypothetical protein
MPQQREKKANSNTFELSAPQITDLGKWPSVEKEIRRRLRGHDVPAEEIELFLDEIRESRKALLE